MGCSPSQAIIIQSSSTSHETVCLKPTIYMVSESTVKMLQDVGELKVFHVDDSDHGKIEEKYGHVGDQLANPLVYQPQVRSSRTRSAGWGRNENTSLTSSITTINSQQRLENDASSHVKLEEDNSSTTLVERPETEYKNKNDIALSETDKMQIKHVNTPETDDTHNSVLKERQISEQENTERTSSRKESKQATHVKPKFMNQNKVTPYQILDEISEKEQFDTLTAVQSQKMFGYSSKFTGKIELATRFLDDTESREQKNSQLSDISDTEQESANSSTVSANKEEATNNLAAAQKNDQNENKESELGKIAGNNDKYTTSNKGMLIKVKGMILDDE